MEEFKPRIPNNDLVFFRFVAANSALLQCYADIGEDNIKAMSKSQMDTQCSKEKMAITRILNSNEMTMSRVIKDRIAVLKELEHKPLIIEDPMARENNDWAFKQKNAQ